MAPFASQRDRSGIQTGTYGVGSGGDSGGTMSTQDILGKYEAAYQEAKQANEARYQQALGIADKAISRYQPGGQFGQGAMAQYEEGKHDSVSAGMGSLIDSGISNTTIGGTLPLAYEQQVGAKYRLMVEDMRMGKLTEAEQYKSNVIQAREDQYPDYAMFAQLAMQAANQPSNDTYGGLGPNARAGLDVFGDPLSKFGESKSSGSSYSMPRTNTGITYGSKRPGTTTSSPQKTGKSLSEEEYMKLLNQNLAAGGKDAKTSPYDMKTSQPTTAPTTNTGGAKPVSNDWQSGKGGTMFKIGSYYSQPYDVLGGKTRIN